MSAANWWTFRDKPAFLARVEKQVAMMVATDICVNDVLVAMQIPEVAIDAWMAARVIDVLYEPRNGWRSYFTEGAGKWGDGSRLRFKKNSGPQSMLF